MEVAPQNSEPVSSIAPKSPQVSASPSSPNRQDLSEQDLAEVKRWLERAQTLVGQQRWAESLDVYRRVAERLPEWNVPHLNLAIAFLSLERWDEAGAALERSIARKPDCWKSHFNLALLHLRGGRFVEGWQEYDWRFRARGMPAGRAGRPQPLWKGEPLQGETVLLCAEQGMGDILQFLRFVPAVVARGARVLLECPAPLKPLLETFPGISGFVDPSASDDLADYQFPLLSVPRLLGEAFELNSSSIPYLRPPEGKVTGLEQLLGNPRSFKVGVVWQGDPDNPFNTVRSCRPEDFRPLAALPNVSLVSLQYRDGGCSEDHLGALGIRSLGPLLGDFGEVAKITGQLDLILTVDTVTAHLGGALGRPTWVVLSRPCDWRWPTEGADTPWYPNLRLFHQSTPGDWQSVFSAVADTLRILIS